MGVLSRLKRKLLLWLHKYYVCSKFKVNYVFLQSVAHVYLTIHFKGHERKTLEK